MVYVSFAAALAAALEAAFLPYFIDIRSSGQEALVNKVATII